MKKKLDYLTNTANLIVKGAIVTNKSRIAGATSFSIPYLTFTPSKLYFDWLMAKVASGIIRFFSKWKYHRFNDMALLNYPFTGFYLRCFQN